MVGVGKTVDPGQDRRFKRAEMIHQIPVTEIPSLFQINEMLPFSVSAESLPGGAGVNSYRAFLKVILMLAKGG